MIALYRTQGRSGTGQSRVAVRIRAQRVRSKAFAHGAPCAAPIVKQAPSLHLKSGIIAGNFLLAEASRWPRSRGPARLRFALGLLNAFVQKLLGALQYAQPALGQVLPRAIHIE